MKISWGCIENKGFLKTCFFSRVPKSLELRDSNPDKIPQTFFFSYAKGSSFFSCRRINFRQIKLASLSLPNPLTSRIGSGSPFREGGLEEWTTHFLLLCSRMEKREESEREQYFLSPIKISVRYLSGCLIGYILLPRGRERTMPSHNRPTCYIFFCHHYQYVMMMIFYPTHGRCMVCLIG